MFKNLGVFKLFFYMLAAKGLPPKYLCLKTSILAKQWELIKNSNSEV